MSLAEQERVYRRYTRNAAAYESYLEGRSQLVRLTKESTLAAIAAFERASVLEDSLRYDEPEPLPFSPKHWLGAALLEANRAADAERVYRAELTLHPRNGWSLLGLEQALRAQSRSEEADRVREEFRTSRARSDHVMRSSRP